MRDHGHQTTAVLPSNEGIAEWYDNADIETIKFWSEPLRRRRNVLGQLQYLVFCLFAIFRLTIYVRRDNFELIHVNDVRFFPGLIAGKLGGATCVCHVRANYESKTIRYGLSGLVLLFSDRVLCVSERTREIMFEEVGLPIDNVDVLYDSVPDPERFTDDGPTSFRENHDIDADETLVLNVSKLTKNKGQDRILKAAEQVTDAVSDVVFVFVGGVVEGHEEYADRIRQQAEDRDAFRMVGFVPDITEALVASDVSVHVPRHDDPFPGVVLEGMLAGNPVVGSRSGGIPEQIDHGETGYLVPRTDGTDVLARQLVQICQDDEGRIEMGKTASRRCREKFPLDDFFYALNEVYEEELGE